MKRQVFLIVIGFCVHGNWIRSCIREKVGLSISFITIDEGEARGDSLSVIEITVRVIEEVEDVSLRADLMTTVSILAEDCYASELIKKIIRREMLMGSELLKEWTAEERKEAAIENSKQTLILQLKTKYGDIPEELESQMMDMDDQDTLNDLLVQLIKTTNLDDFLVKLEKKLKDNSDN